MPKLNTAHFELTDQTRMKVKLATQVLSNSVNSRIRTFVDLGQMEEEALQTASFVKELNDMFDLLNIHEK